jgi:hypothetical protein
MCIDYATALPYYYGRAVREWLLACRAGSLLETEIKLGIRNETLDWEKLQEWKFIIC